MSEEDDQLRAESVQIEHLLDEIQGLVTAPAWERIEKLIGRIVRMHGAGLARTLDHARAAGAGADFAERIAGDDLVASLLALHGVHPLAVEERVLRAIAAASTELGLAEGALELAGIADGTVQLRAAAHLGGGAMAARVAEGAIRRAVEAAAPEIAAVELLGALPPPQPPKLIQIRARKEAR